MSIDDVPRGPLGEAYPEKAGDKGKTPGSLPPEKVEDRDNVGTATPDDYPREDRDAGDPAAANRGKRAGGGSGPVSGSGAGAGGKGNPEDFDSDPQGGGGSAPIRTDNGPKHGADAPVGGSR
ncbi:hypothetical protein [Sphingopyxis sp.]|uniref:hypothetical protein n=1 Tax=Sphingopyxis sp. TaxID=1908224 RepID=UPI002D78077F|nr:hypothetical protein [Sphingopyxis sp.]HET6526877.1 hypothetical protein [Sphingopyxis sp.]